MPKKYEYNYAILYYYNKKIKATVGKPSVLEASTLSEGCKPEYWFGGEGGHRFYVVCPRVVNPSTGLGCRGTSFKLGLSVRPTLCTDFYVVFLQSTTLIKA
jgi:hypothetical protein